MFKIKAIGILILFSILPNFLIGAEKKKIIYKYKNIKNLTLILFLSRERRERQVICRPILEKQRALKICFPIEKIFIQK